MQSFKVRLTNPLITDVRAEMSTSALLAKNNSAEDGSL